MGTCFPEHPSPSIPPEHPPRSWGEGGPFLDGETEGWTLRSAVLGTLPSSAPPPIPSPGFPSPFLKAVLRMQLCC